MADTEKTANYVQQVGLLNCVRCAWKSSDGTWDEKIAELRRHNDHAHPGWLLDGSGTLSPVEAPKVDWTSDEEVVRAATRAKEPQCEAYKAADGIRSDYSTGGRRMSLGLGPTWEYVRRVDSHVIAYELAHNPSKRASQAQPEAGKRCMVEIIRPSAEELWDQLEKFLQSMHKGACGDESPKGLDEAQFCVMALRPRDPKPAPSSGSPLPNRPKLIAIDHDGGEHEPSANQNLNDLYCNAEEVYDAISALEEQVKELQAELNFYQAKVRGFEAQTSLGKTELQERLEAK